MTKKIEKPWVDPRPELLKWLAERLDKPLSEWEISRLEEKIRAGKKK